MELNFKSLSAKCSLSSVVLILSTLALASYLVLIIIKPTLALYPLFLGILLCGIPINYRILRKIVQGELGADILAVIALLTAVLMQEYLAAILIIIMLAGGGALESYAMRKASSVLNELAGRMPSIAHRKIGEIIEDVPLEYINIGDSVVIYPHETAVVDGQVIEGQSTMDESYLTGEPYRVSKAPGVNVLSGAINGEGVIVICAEKLPADSRYANIMKVMQDAEQKRPHIRRLADLLGTVFAPMVFGFALLAFYITGDPIRFLAILVVATPCPLLIGIPITIISAISLAARRGIIIKDPTVLEQLPTCKTAIFDKTGTLTYGEPTLTSIFTAPDIQSDRLLQIAASLERYSKHPLASAIIEAASVRGISLVTADAISEAPGAGLTGMIANTQYSITHRKHYVSMNPKLEDILPPTATGLECIILREGQYVGTCQFKDAPRSEGKSFISHLGPNHLFNKIMILSGDRESEVSYLANLLDIPDILFSQTPEQKVEVVRQETSLHPTLFMGDGINDAPALACATVGIAFGQNSAITAGAAGAVIMESNLAKVDELLHISIAMRKIALQSAIGGMTLSFIAMFFAAYGAISPVGGALLQDGIDALAILNALRLSFFKSIPIDLPSITK